MRTERASGHSSASCYGRKNCLCKRGRLASRGLPGFGSNLAERGLVWLSDKLLGLLPLPSSVTKTNQSPPLSLYGRGLVSLPPC